MNDNSPHLPDAIKLNWVDIIAPDWSIPYLRLSRMDRPIGTWLLLIPCWWGLCLGILESDTKVGLYDFWLAISFTLGAILMRGAGCTWNDINDWKLDSKVQRTKLRPIPSGQVSNKKAFAWMTIQALASFLILLSFPSFSIFVGIVSLLPVIIYPYAKRFTWWPQIFLGIAFNWGILLGFSTQGLGISLGCFILYIAGIFWTLFYDTIYAFQDIDDDSIVGIKSTARLFKENAASWLFTFVISFFILAGLAFYVSLFHISETIFFICFLGVFIFCCSLFIQLIKLDTKLPHVCLKLFRSNKMSGLILCLFLAGSLFLSI